MRDLISLIIQLLPVRYLCGTSYLQVLPATPTRSVLNEKVLSHSLASPLTTLSCALDECLENPKKLTNKALRSKITAAYNHLESLYKTWQRGHQQAVSQFSVATSIHESIILSGIKEKSQVILQINVPKTTRLLGNKALFQEMLICLLNNAHESYHPDDPYKTVLCTVKQLPEKLLLEIIDSGSGMNRIAQVVACLDGVSFKQSGRGVGLPFAKTVVEQLFAGSLYLCSEPGLGTRICISLPTRKLTAR